MNLFGGIEVRTSPLILEQVEDWSRVRSPSRAARRHRRGFRQNVRVVEVPREGGYRVGSTIYMHPVTYEKFAAMLDRMDPKNGSAW